MSRSLWFFAVTALALSPIVAPTVAAAQTDASTPLSGSTLGPGLPPAAVVAGAFDLSVAGDVDLGGFIFSGGVPFLHNDGGYGYGNSAWGSTRW